MLFVLAGFVSLLGILGGSCWVLGKGRGGKSRNGTLDGNVGIGRMMVNATWSLLKRLQRARQARQARVVLVGMTGVGKSTLGNSLAFGEQDLDQGGFEVGHGMDSKTTVCRGLTYKSGCGEMTVYDTPGVPDTDKEKTLERFNEIVRTVRGLPALNVIIFLFKMGKQYDSDYEAYRILFRQYTKLPCPLVMVCRVNVPEGCKKRVKDQIEKGALGLIDKVTDNCNLKRARVHKLIYRNGKIGKKDVKKLRHFLDIMPGIPVAEETLMTSAEMEERLSRLSHHEKRMEELKKEITRLEKNQESLHAQIADLDERIGEWEAKGLLGVKASVEIAALGDTVQRFFFFATSVCLGINFPRWRISMLKGSMKITTDNLISNDEELAKVMGEVESRTVDLKELQNAREEHEQLLKLTNR